MKHPRAQAAPKKERERRKAQEQQAAYVKLASGIRAKLIDQFTEQFAETDAERFAQMIMRLARTTDHELVTQYFNSRKQEEQAAEEAVGDTKNEGESE